MCICENICKWKNILKYINYHLKTENGWLKTLKYINYHLKTENVSLKT